MNKRRSLQDQIDTVRAACGRYSSLISQLREERDRAILAFVLAATIIVFSMGVALYTYPRSTTYEGFM